MALSVSQQLLNTTSPFGVYAFDAVLSFAHALNFTLADSSSECSANTTLLKNALDMVKFTGASVSICKAL